MVVGEAHDFTLEKRLKELDPVLHKNYTDTVFVMQRMLSKFKMLFPGYTDHSLFHSLNVIDFCNRLIGEQLERLNADEIYVLLMSCYLHDSGMAISKNDYMEFKEELPEEEFFRQMPECDIPDFVREYHNEFSGLFIRKYADFFEIPDEEHLFAIVQVSRGHRRTDLFDVKEYPVALLMPSKNTVCVPYLAALIRLADEIDVVAERNPKLLYDIDTISDETAIMHNRMLEAVPRMDILTDGFMLYVNADDEALFAAIQNRAGKMQATLDLCRSVTENRTGFHISQQWVRLHRMK